jgi:hypothetical protein
MANLLSFTGLDAMRSVGEVRDMRGTEGVLLLPVGEAGSDVGDMDGEWETGMLSGEATVVPTSCVLVLPALASA